MRGWYASRKSSVRFQHLLEVGRLAARCVETPLLIVTLLGPARTGDRVSYRALKHSVRGAEVGRYAADGRCWWYGDGQAGDDDEGQCDRRRMVGGAVAQYLVLRDYADIVLVDIVEGRPTRQGPDLAETAPVLGYDSTITGSNGYAVLMWS